MLLRSLEDKAVRATVACHAMAHSGLWLRSPSQVPLTCRDAEVLSLFAAIITKLRELMAPEVPRVFEAIFECTLQMITKNFAVSVTPYTGLLLLPLKALLLQGSFAFSFIMLGHDEGEGSYPLNDGSYPYSKPSGCQRWSSHDSCLSVHHAVHVCACSCRWRHSK